MRLIDADELAKEWTIASPEPYNTDAVEVLDSIREAPTVDAVPVVYCKDCKYADAERRNVVEKRYADSILFCRNSGLCNDEPLAMWPVDFCSYGVARRCADDEP